MPSTKLSVFIAALAVLASPAGAQTPVRSAAEITLTDAEAQAGYTLLGEVRAEIHQKSMMPKTPSRDLADKELREKAARLGADAVVGVKYENNNPMLSKKGFVATGKAVKFSGTAVAAVPPALASAPSFSATGAPSAIPAPVVVAAAPVPAPAPGAIVTLPGVVPLIEGAAPWAHTVLGPVRAEIHQKSMMPKTPSRELADQELRAQAARLGADAVVNIKRENNSAMFSTKGYVATGTAVKAAVTAPVQAPVQAAVATPVAPPVQAAVPAPAPAVAAAVAPTAPAAIVLSEQNIARAYAVLGPINAEIDPAAVTLDKTGRQVLDEEMRRQAARMGADAVILIRYTASITGKGPAAIGVAVKFN